MVRNWDECYWTMISTGHNRSFRPRCRVRENRLKDKHCVAKRVKPVSKPLSRCVSFQNSFTAGQGTHQQEQCGFRQMKIGDQRVGQLEAVSWQNVEIGRT